MPWVFPSTTNRRLHEFVYSAVVAITAQRNFYTMSARITALLFFIALYGICPAGVWAQATAQPPGGADNEAALAAAAYISSRTRSVEKYLRRSDRIRQRLLRKLARTERRASGDSLSSRGPSFDSIAKLSRDTAALNSLPGNKHKLIDSLEKIRGFITSRSDKADAFPAGASPERLHDLRRQINSGEQADRLINDRSKALAGAVNTAALSKLQRKIALAQQKARYWQALSEDPDEAEAKAWEYLQGTEGFDKYLRQDEAAPYGGLGNDATAADLERLGYQTKRQVSAGLQQQFGNQAGQVAGNMGQQIQDYRQQFGSAKESVSKLKEQAGAAKQALSHGRQDIPGLRRQAGGAGKNPFNGIPFWKRWKLSYDFQTTRATADGLRPAMLTPGAGAVFNHTPKWSYGIALSAGMGMGKDWQHLRLSYEGLAARVYADCKLWYGFSLQAGYEKSLRPSGRSYIAELEKGGDARMVETALGVLQDAAYAGIMKRYRINKRWSGTMLIGYNFLWQQSGLRSPFVLSMGWEK